MRQAESKTLLPECHHLFWKHVEICLGFHGIIAGKLAAAQLAYNMFGETTKLKDITHWCSGMPTDVTDYNNLRFVVRNVTGEKHALRSW